MKPGVISRLRYSLHAPRHPRSVVGYARMLWNDFVIHPLFGGTEICEDCGRGYVLWQADEALWREVMGEGAGLWCPDCFERRCEEKGIIIKFLAVLFRRTGERPCLT